MRPLRNFKTTQCCHLIVAADTREAFGGARRSRAESRRPSRIANRAFFLWLSVDDEKQWKARWRDFARFEQSLPDRVPHLPDKGSDKVAEVGLHRGCCRREESLSARQAVQDSAQGKGGGLCLTPPLQPHH